DSVSALPPFGPSGDRISPALPGETRSHGGVDLPLWGGLVDEPQRVAVVVDHVRRPFDSVGDVLHHVRVAVVGELTGGDRRPELLQRERHGPPPVRPPGDDLLVTPAALPALNERFDPL